MHLAELVERLHSDFPGDVGVFGPYLFNHLSLQPGQAIFLPANEPHAYLCGGKLSIAFRLMLWSGLR